ncbi:MAG: branched-chain amino acid ABC transporter permease [Desulfatiglans sp.]|nr:branched-chain amino acid ABC transporter permease [Thermodesulfobacteriota bacterium]MEE4353119.1 branched-chain amino acid ABC transporter permease [Desulfatiglans sp.]
MAIRSKTFHESYREDIKLFETIWIKFWIGLFLVVLSVLPLIGDPYIVYLINLSCIATIAALGLNILTGFTGQISLGHAAFFAIGAYSTAIIADRLEVPFWICLPASGVLAACAGLLVGVPCLRLKGLYLAMATMSFGVVVEFVVITWENVTKGVRGMSVPTLSLLGFSLDSNNKLYYFLIVLTALAIIAATNLMRTRVGRAFIAIRDRDIAAEVIGVNLTQYKVMAFVISSFYAGVAGGLYAYVMEYIHPEHFTFLLSVQYLAMIIVGGLGSILGSVFGAVFITVIPEFIKALAQFLTLLFPVLQDKYDDGWNIAAFGLLIILFLIFEPKGLSGVWMRIKTCFKNWPYTY